MGIEEYERDIYRGKIMGKFIAGILEWMYNTAVWILGADLANENIIEEAGDDSDGKRQAT